MLAFFGSRQGTCACISWIKEEGWKCFCRFVFVFYSIIKTLRTNLNSMIKKKTYCSLTAQIFFNLQNRPSFHSKERLVNLERGRECIVVLSILLVYVHSVYVHRAPSPFQSQCLRTCHPLMPPQLLDC